MNENIYTQNTISQSSPIQITVEQVIEALVKGITPEELLKAGVPQELLEKAIQVIMQQQQIEQSQAGLAGKIAAENMVQQNNAMGIK